MFNYLKVENVRQLNNMKKHREKGVGIRLVLKRKGLSRGFDGPVLKN